jgi:hypothetical protein
MDLPRRRGLGRGALARPLTSETFCAGQGFCAKPGVPSQFERPSRCPVPVPVSRPGPGVPSRSRCPVPVPRPFHKISVSRPSSSARPRSGPVAVGPQNGLFFLSHRCPVPVPSRCRRPVPFRALRPEAASRRPAFQKACFSCRASVPSHCPVPVAADEVDRILGLSRGRLRVGLRWGASPKREGCGQNLYSALEVA